LDVLWTLIAMYICPWSNSRNLIRPEQLRGGVRQKCQALLSAAGPAQAGAVGDRVDLREDDYGEVEDVEESDEAFAGRGLVVP
jgi:hypothetical protein